MIQPDATATSGLAREIASASFNRLCVGQNFVNSKAISGSRKIIALKNVKNFEVFCKIKKII